MKSLELKKEELDPGNYLEQMLTKPAISLEELKKICEGNEKLELLLMDMLDYCLRYTETVIQMNKELLEKNYKVDQDIEEVDRKRSLIHNSTIDSINIFSRALHEEGKDNSWVGNFSGIRAAYGKFAILITLSRLTN